MPVGAMMAVALLASCSGAPKDCAVMEAGNERDACYLEQVAAHAEAGEGNQAIDGIRSIDSPLLRSAAIQTLAATEGSGVDSSVIERLCQELPSSPAQDCLKNWARPHLWERPTERNPQ